MRTLVDARLVAEAGSHNLRFECDDCVHFSPSPERCGHGYPIDVHRPGGLALGKTIVFCKEFELGDSDAPVDPR